MNATLTSPLKLAAAALALVIAPSLGAATVSGDAIEVASDIHHPNGNVYDQVLMQGALATVQADPGQIVRLSYLDLGEEIVQVEFSGKGSLTLLLANVSGPAPAAKYNQPGVAYVRGHASIVIKDPDATTNLAVFSVGRNNAVNQALFRGDVTYSGMADMAVISIQPAATSPNGISAFGSIRAGNVQLYATEGYTGISAPNIAVTGLVVIGDLSAYENATPVLLFNPASTFGTLSVAGGDLFQPNGSSIQMSGFDHLAMINGTDSRGVVLPQQINLGHVTRGGIDVTSQIVSYPVATAISAATVTIGDPTTSVAVEVAASATGVPPRQPVPTPGG